MKTYFQQTRTLAFSLLAVTPLLLFYEISILSYAAIPVRNMAEKLIKDALAAVGLVLQWQLAVAYGLIVLFVVLHAKWKNKVQLPPLRYWGGMILESLAYATVFGVVTRNLVQLLLAAQAAPAQNRALYHEILLAVAAGLYEEFLFRLILLGSILFIFNRIWPTKAFVRAAVASAIQACVFAIFHYAGISNVYWDQFIFRLVAGWLLGLLYVYRGLAVSVYTHAFYDILYILKAI